MNKFKQVSDMSEELARLSSEKASLMKQLARAYRIKEVWPEAFGTLGKVETFTTSLGGTGTIPRVTRYWIERMEDNSKREVTEEQWNYIEGDDK